MKATHAGAVLSSMATPLRYKCIVSTCTKMYELPYGRWGDEGTCSRECESAQEKLMLHFVIRSHDQKEECV